MRQTPFVLNCQPYGSPFWVSFRQAKGLGGHVRRGERGTPIWFWKWYEKEQPDGERKRIPVLRRYTVFNVQQCGGLEERVPALTDPDRQPFSPIERCERIAAGMRGIRNRALIALMYYCGLRLSEVLALLPRDVDLGSPIRQDYLETADFIGIIWRKRMGIEPTLAGHSPAEQRF